MLLYNENKVAQQQAHIILANGFAADIDGLNTTQKLKRFENLTMLNTAVKTNAVHISLNFAKEDKLDDAKLQTIALDYMERIGFGDQPFLVYRHTDAAHTHVHIATTNVKADGNRIDIHNIGRTLSETARVAIENSYRLVRAEDRSESNQIVPRLTDIEKVIYGRHLTKRAITNVVNHVVRSYKFGSLAELNAVLKQYNVLADRGAEDTLMHQKKGLLYSIIDEEGVRIGIPIKASSIYGKPTLANLEKKFQKGIERRKPYLNLLKSTIDNVFAKYNSVTRSTLMQELSDRGVSIVFRQNEAGYVYGVTYVDHQSKTVFNGSALGKAYSAKSIVNRMGDRDQLVLGAQDKTRIAKKEQSSYLKAPSKTSYIKSKTQVSSVAAPVNLLKSLLSPKPYIEEPSIKKKRKRKRPHPGEQQEIQQSNNSY